VVKGDGRSVAQLANKRPPALTRLTAGASGHRVQAAQKTPLNKGILGGDGGGGIRTFEPPVTVNGFRDLSGSAQPRGLSLVCDRTRDTHSLSEAASLKMSATSGRANGYKPPSRRVAHDVRVGACGEAWVVDLLTRQSTENRAPLENG
jgi:hypothetical protein